MNRIAPIGRPSGVASDSSARWLAEEARRPARFSWPEVIESPTNDGAMTERWDFVPSCASEFPNDNPVLHGGVTWACLGPLGPLRPIVRARPPRSVEAVPAAVRNEAARVRPPSDVPALNEPVSREATGDPAPELLSEVANEVVPEAGIEPEQADAAIASEVAPEAGIEALPEQADAAITDEETADASREAGSDAAPAISPSASPDEGSGALSSDEGVFTIEPGSTPDEALHVGTDDQDGFALAAEPAPTEATFEAAPVVPDAYQDYLGALREVARASGAEHAAELLTSLMDGSADIESAGEETLARMMRSGIVNGETRQLADGFVATAGAWRRVLRSESPDLSACGDATLDAWSADLLKALGIGEGGGLDVKRELRRRGVAAFGMRVAA